MPSFKIAFDLPAADTTRGKYGKYGKYMYARSCSFALQIPANIKQKTRDKLVYTIPVSFITALKNQIKATPNPTIQIKSIQTFCILHNSEHMSSQPRLWVLNPNWHEG